MVFRCRGPDRPLRTDRDRLRITDGRHAVHWFGAGNTDSHLATDPVSIAVRHRGLPRPSSALVIRRLAKDAADRSSDAGEVMGVLESLPRNVTADEGVAPAMSAAVFAASRPRLLPASRIKRVMLLGMMSGATAVAVVAAVSVGREVPLEPVPNDRLMVAADHTAPRGPVLQWRAVRRSPRCPAAQPAPMSRPARIRQAGPATFRHAASVDRSIRLARPRSHLPRTPPAGLDGCTNAALGCCARHCEA